MKGNSILSNVPEGCLTVALLAVLTGVDKSTIDRWVGDGWLECDRITMGQLNVRIFNTAQQRRAVRLAQYAKSRTPLATRHDHTRTNPDGSPRVS